MEKNDNIKSGKAVLTIQNPKNIKEEYNVSLSFFVFERDGKYIAYCPSLDLSSSGDSFNEAVSSFYEALQLYFECCSMYNTLHEDLLAHGWTFKNKDIVPPSFESMMQKEELKALMNSTANFERIVTPTKIPAFA